MNIFQEDQADKPTLTQAATFFEPRRARSIIGLLAASVGLIMTGYGIVMPIFGRRLGDLGSGVPELGFMTMAFALAHFLLAPFMGSLADRFGRRPFILLGLAGAVIANVAFLFVESTGAFITTRFLQGAITAGLLPAAMGIVADIVPEQQRAQWVGILTGSYSVGFIFGPALGGFLYDRWGFIAPFGLSAGLALVGLLLAFLLVPETRPATVRSQVTSPPWQNLELGRVLASLPRPLYILTALLLLEFVGVFAFTFIEPQMIFYFYDELGFTPTQFGLIVGGYGLAVVFGQTMLGHLSDRFGRKLIIVLGFSLNLLFYLSLMVVERFGLMFFVGVIAGLGVALAAPALNAYYLDLTTEAHRARVMGLKESAAALGGVAGPLLVAVVSSWLPPATVFLTAALVTLGAVLLILIVLPARGRRTLPSPPSITNNFGQPAKYRPE